MSHYGRYRVLPVAGNEYLDETEAARCGPYFLFDEIKERVAKEPVRFRVVMQLADEGDTVDDATVRWPEDRPQLAFGEINLQEITPNNAGEQRQIIFDPIPRVDGIEASADPLFEPRANVYLMSGRRRRIRIRGSGASSPVCGTPPWEPVLTPDSPVAHPPDLRVCHWKATS